MSHGEFDCDSNVMDDRFSAYYSHLVWLLNGLFIAQHAQILENPRRFFDWVVSQKPQRAATTHEWLCVSQD